MPPGRLGEASVQRFEIAAGAASRRCCEMNNSDSPTVIELRITGRHNPKRDGAPDIARSGALVPKGQG